LPGSSERRDRRAALVNAPLWQCSDRPVSFRRELGSNGTTSLSSSPKPMPRVTPIATKRFATVPIVPASRTSVAAGTRRAIPLAVCRGPRDPCWPAAGRSADTPAGALVRKRPLSRRKREPATLTTALPRIAGVLGQRRPHRDRHEREPSRPVVENPARRVVGLAIDRGNESDVDREQESLPSVLELDAECGDDAAIIDRVVGPFSPQDFVTTSTSVGTQRESVEWYPVVSGSSGDPHPKESRPRFGGRARCPACPTLALRSRRPRKLAARPERAGRCSFRRRPRRLAERGRIATLAPLPARHPLPSGTRRARKSHVGKGRASSWTALSKSRSWSFSSESGPWATIEGARPLAVPASVCQQRLDDGGQGRAHCSAPGRTARYRMQRCGAQP
jgi:hypothetical protein